MASNREATERTDVSCPTATGDIDTAIQANSPVASDQTCVLSAERFHAQRESDIRAEHQFVPGARAIWPLSSRMHKYYDGMFEDWLKWWSPEVCGSTILGHEKLGYPISKSWVDESRSVHRHLCDALLDEPLDPSAHEIIDAENATDYWFQTMLGGAKTVLDFGAGYGRQAILWSKLSHSLSFTAVDGIEGPYLLQNRVLRNLEDSHFVEYFDAPDTFKITPPVAETKTIFHLPTWRLDLLPSASFDLIICSQVLQELDQSLVVPLLGEFRRILAPQGRLYIRDHEEYRPAHKIHIGKTLLKGGWRLVFRYPGIDKHDIHGIPRMWRYTGEDNSDLISLTSIWKRRLWLAAPWTRQWSDTKSAKHGTFRKGLWRYLRKGKPRADDFFTPHLPV